MSRVTVNDDLQTKLAGLQQAVELYDASGRILGHFIPIPALKREPQVSEEELRRREQSTERRYTTAEVLDHLRKL